MAFYVPPKTPTSYFGVTTPYTTSPTVYPSGSIQSYFDETAPIPTPTTYSYAPSNELTETTNLPLPLPAPSYNPGTYTPSSYDAGPIPAPTYVAPSAPAYVEPYVEPSVATPTYTAPAPYTEPVPAVVEPSTDSSAQPVSDLGPAPDFFAPMSALLAQPSAASSQAPTGLPDGGSSAPSGQSPSLAALQGLLGRSSGGVQSPGLQSLLESTAGRLGGQARQRYGRQFQTFLANQRAAQSQRGDAMAGMGDTGASSLQGSMQMQMALDRLRAALDLPSRTPQRSRAPSFASSSSAGGGLSSSSTSPYLY